MTQDEFQRIKGRTFAPDPNDVIKLVDEVERLHPEWMPKWRVACTSATGRTLAASYYDSVAGVADHLKDNPHWTHTVTCRP